MSWKGLENLYMERRKKGFEFISIDQVLSDIKNHKPIRRIK